MCDRRSGRGGTPAARRAAGTGPSLLIRFAAPQDAPALVELEAACFETDRMSRRAIRRWISRANGCFLVADVDGMLAAAALVVFRKLMKAARIESLAVHPDYRGRGLGVQLIQRAEAEVANRGLQQLNLEVAVDNEEAIRLYERAGFAVFDRVPGFYEDGRDALRMTKHLPAEVSDESLAEPHSDTNGEIPQ